MASRMDRHNTTNTVSRSKLNQELYDSIGKNEKEIDYSYINVSNAIDINEARNNSHTRDGYKKMLHIDSDFNVPKEQHELDEFNYIYKDKGKNIFDLDKYLADAHERRSDDENESIKKLDDEKYNILNNRDSIEKYNYNKKVVRPNDKAIRELIDTITSKTLAGEIDKATTVDLLSDLMATSMIDRVEAQLDDDINIDPEITSVRVKDKMTNKLEDISHEVLGNDELNEIKKIEDETTSNTVMRVADKDFYSKSIELSTKDFDDGIDDSFSEKKNSHTILLLIIFILVVIAIAVGVYYFVTSYLQ